MERKIKYRTWTDQELAYLKGNLDNRSNVYLSKLMGRTINSLESMKRDLRNGDKKVSEDFYKAYIHKRPDYYDWIKMSNSYMNMYVLHKRSVQKEITNDIGNSMPEATLDRVVENPSSCADEKKRGMGINPTLTKRESKDRLISLIILAIVVVIAVVLGIIFY